MGEKYFDIVNNTILFVQGNLSKYMGVQILSELIFYYNYLNLNLMTIFLFLPVFIDSINLINYHL